MKKSLIFLVFIICILLLLLCSCETKISIDLEKPYFLDSEIIKCELYNEKNHSPFEYINANGFEKHIYTDPKCKNITNEILELKDGNNIFYIKFENTKSSYVYKLEINNVKIVNLELEKKYDVTYYSNSEFDYNSIILYGIKENGEKIILDDYKVEYSFSKPGENIVKIKSCGFVIETQVNVSSSNIIVIDDRFVSSNGLEFVKKGSSFYIKSGKEYKGIFVIPDSLIYNEKTYPIKGIMDYAFENNEEITKIICNYPIEIGEGAFSNCTKLEYASFSSGCIFGEFSFDHCSNLKTIILPEDLLSIPNNMMSYCDSLKEISLPDTLEEIGSQAFYECISIENIAIPQKVKLVGARAFKYCDNLKYASCGSSVEFIGEGAFSYCASLEILLIPPLSNFEDASVVYGDENVTVYTGKSSPILYYLKTDGKKYVTLSDDSIYILNSKTEYNLNESFDPSSIYVIVFSTDEMYITSTFGYKYNFDVPGKTNVLITVKDKNKTTPIFVENRIYMYDYISENGEEFYFDYDSKKAYLQSIDDVEEYIIPTKIVYDGVEFDVKGIFRGAISNKSKLKRLVLGSEIEEIFDSAINKCPNLELIYVSTPIGQKLVIGEDNFTDLSDNLIIQTTFNNSIMHNYVRTHKLNYCGIDCDEFYVIKSKTGNSTYKPGDEVDKSIFTYFYVDFDLQVKSLSEDEIELLYDFNESNTIVFKYKEYITEYKVNVEN